MVYVVKMSLGLIVGQEALIHLDLLPEGFPNQTLAVSCMANQEECKDEVPVSQPGNRDFNVFLQHSDGGFKFCVDPELSSTGTLGWTHKYLGEGCDITVPNKLSQVMEPGLNGSKARVFIPCVRRIDVEATVASY